jgi:hypothetical protein
VYYLYVARNLGGVIGLTTFEAIAAQVCVQCISHIISHMYATGTITTPTLAHLSNLYQFTARAVCNV